MRQLRKLRIWLIGLVVLACASATLPLARNYCADQVTAALQSADLRSAETWLTRLQQLGRQHPEALRLELRCLRKKFAIQEFQIRLEEARRAGLAESVLQHELILASAQAGDLAGLQQKLPDLLLAGEDLEEVCESFVVGCLLCYRLDDAVRVLEIWRQDFPESARPVFLRSRLREHSDELPEAAEGYRQALKLNPRFGPAAFSLGRALEETGQLDEALAAYSNSRDLLYHPEPALVSMVRVLRLQNRFDEAQSLLTSPEISSGSREARELSWLLAGAKQWNAIGDRLLEIAELHAARGDNAQAIKVFQELMEVAPRRWKARYRLAMLLRDSGDEEQARLEISRFKATSDAVDRCDTLLSRVRNDPRDVDARFEIACEFLEHISESQGIFWLRTVLELDPNHAGALDKLESLNAARNDRSMADRAPR